MPRQLLYVSQILHWADDYRDKYGQWPRMYSGPIPGTLELTWRKVDSALRLGHRGLPGKSSLAQFLAEHRGVRNLGCLPKLNVSQVLKWADSYYEKKGVWPKETSGPVPQAPGETWFAVDRALRAGVRGFGGGTSLAQVMADKRGARNIQALPHLTIKQILAWADAHQRRTGCWPTGLSGTIPEAPGETWGAVNTALTIGRRGLPGRSSLPRLLARRRGARNPKDPPQLKKSRILRWAKAHQRRTGQWPTHESGPIQEATGETWAMVDRALRHGKRGLRGGVSLFWLLRPLRLKLLKPQVRRTAKSR